MAALYQVADNERSEGQANADVISLPDVQELQRGQGRDQAFAPDSQSVRRERAYAGQ